MVVMLRVAVATVVFLLTPACQVCQEKVQASYGQ